MEVIKNVTGSGENLPEGKFVKVAEVQLQALIKQRDEAIVQANDMRNDFQHLAETYSKLFDELGIGKDASKMMMFTKMTKFAKRILIDGDVPEYFKSNRFLEMLQKYSTLQAHSNDIKQIESKDENTSK